MVDCKRWIKRGLVTGRLLSLTQRLLSPRTVILRYHSVKVAPGDYENSIGKGIVHSQAAFTEQMEWLARTYEPVTLDDVASAVVDQRPMPKRGVLITFDDGYADNFDVALPVLDRLGIKAAFYITVDCVEHRKMPWFCRLRHAFAATGRETWQDPSEHRLWRLRDAGDRHRAFLGASEACARQSGAAQDDLIGRIESGLGVSTLASAERLMMNWDQIRELHSRRHVVGSHTLTHPNLTRVGGDELVREMRESRKKLEEKLASPVRHFSYPNPILQPHWSEETVACCKESGYQTAVTCTPGPVRAADSPLCLKRIPAPEKMDDFQWTVQCAFLGRYA